jgi:cupin superfamily protein
VERFRAQVLRRAPAVLAPHDRRWRAIGPGFDAALGLARAGVPFQIAADRRYDRSGDPRALPRALAEGRTIFFPQIHQVLPRVARLIVALRVALLGPAREECSFLFAVEGRAREGLGLHHDGDVDAIWLQLEGRRTVTLGPPVAARTPLDLPETLLGHDAGRWSTLDLAPGTLFHLPARTPHRVVCHGRSLAVSLTWTRARGRPDTLAAWDVASGRAAAIPRRDPARMWVQVPVRPGRLGRRPGEFALWTADGAAVPLPAHLRAWAAQLAVMPWLAARAIPRSVREPLVRCGLLAPFDLPRVVWPEQPRELDGWRFA